MLGPGKKLVEATSGNTGLGLAMIGNAEGLSAARRRSRRPSRSRSARCCASSAPTSVELDDSLCPAPGAPEGAIAKARETADNEPDYDPARPVQNDANPDAHFRTTGPEIWRQTEGTVTHFVAGLGTCGTITGTGRFLKEKNPAVKVLGVYPEDGHDIPGVRSKRQLAQTKLYFPNEYDGEIEVVRSRVVRNVPAPQPRREHHRGPEFRHGAGRCAAHGPRRARRRRGRDFPRQHLQVRVVGLPAFPGTLPCARRAGRRPGRAEQERAADGDDAREPEEPVRLGARSRRWRRNSRRDGIARSSSTCGRPSSSPTGTCPAPSTCRKPICPSARASCPTIATRPSSWSARSASTSKKTTLYLKSLGYRHVRNLKGGITEWMRKGQGTEEA